MAKKQEMTEEEKDQAFLQEYEKLCKKHERNVVAQPSWRLSQETGDFRMVINLVVFRHPKKQA